MKNDSAVDIDGAIFTLGQYAKWGDALGDVRALRDGDAAKLGKEPVFQSQHLQVPTRGVALFINAFNFPSWGLWEKAAPALLSGVPVIVKPATATAWLTQRMVRDVVEAGVLPAGALSVICGSSAGLMDQLRAFDVVSFTGSAETGAVIRSHPAVAQRSVRVNIEADSLNSALLLPDAAPGTRRLQPAGARGGARDDGEVGPEVHRDPPHPGAGRAVRRGGRSDRRQAGRHHGRQPAQRERAHGLAGEPRAARTRCAKGSKTLKAQAERAARRQPGSRWSMPTRPSRPASARCCWARAMPMRPTACTTSRCSARSPRCCPTATSTTRIALAHRGQGSLVTSLYGADDAALGQAAVQLAASHGRVHVITPDVAQAHTGHGNVMPMSLHGGPGRAGGGAELGGLRALDFYHRRSAVQASPGVLAQLGLQ